MITAKRMNVFETGQALDRLLLHESCTIDQDVWNSFQDDIKRFFGVPWDDKSMADCVLNRGDIGFSVLAAYLEFATAIRKFRRYTKGAKIWKETSYGYAG